MTEADKLQLLTLGAQIANYGVAYWCLSTQEARKAAGEEPSATGSYLGDWEELGVALAALFFTVAPLMPPAVALYKEHRAEKSKPKAAEKTSNPVSREME